jgi:hypothetical protein
MRIIPIRDIKVRPSSIMNFTHHDFQFKIYIYEYEDKQITSYLTGNE